MPKIPTIFEQELRNQAPARLDADFLDRLTSSAEGTFTDLSGRDAAFASLLASTKPRPLPAALQSSLADALDGVPFAVDEKIVLFSGRAKASPGKPGRFRHFNIAAAAAVALFGATAALMVPQAGPDKTAESASPFPNGKISNANFAPAVYRRNLSETRDEGVIWRGKNQPHRVQRHTYMENVTMKKEDGTTVEVQRPHYEYVITPEVVD